MPMNKRQAIQHLAAISRNYDLAIRAFERQAARRVRGHTTRALEEQAKGFAYIEKAVEAELALRLMIWDA